jgi:hypothetical protein
MSDYAARAAKNEASRDRAEHHWEPWSATELELLADWDGSSEDELAAVAELLGRTIEACRQKFYVSRKQGFTMTTVTRRQVTTSTTKTITYLPPTCYRCGLNHPGDC